MNKILLLLNSVKSISLPKVRKLYDYFGGPDALARATAAQLYASAIATHSESDALIANKNSGFLEKELALIDQEGIRVVDVFSEAYPALLRETAHPPLVLYIKGKTEVLSGMCIAVVGSRLGSLYGLTQAERLGRKLAALGIVVVSGLARGIDTAAHKGAVTSGVTVAVLGSGLNALYPRENKSLAAEIVKKGALVSEFPLHQPPLRENFPRRNRIISGLARGVVVVEATYKSGALITARYALEQNREVFALPGKVDSPLSWGPHQLIKDGARLIEGVEDIIDEFNLTFSPAEERAELSSEEKDILTAIDSEGVFLEEIAARCNMRTNEINKTILTLQLKGLVEEKRPLCYTRKIHA